MTSKQRRRSKGGDYDPRQSLDAARRAAREVAELDDDEIDVDPASELFFEFAAPLLLGARDEQEFEIAATIAEFVWSATHFSSAEQVYMLDEFIQETGVPEEMIPWLIEVYSELAVRKELLVG
ncbi:hypothetical protein BH23CHL1_BH23CHL1_19810 [soil metagenome]